MDREQIFDSHCHYYDEAFDEDRDALLAGLNQKNVGRIVNISEDVTTSRDCIALAEQYDFMYAAVGIHPQNTEEVTESDIDRIRDLSSHERVVAIGEIGLDYHWPEPSPQSQRKWFGRQLELAGEVKLPVVIHSRDAAEETMEILKAKKAWKPGGVIHCYSYTCEMAKEYVDMGFYIGIGGVVTFKKAEELKRCARELPLEKIVLETDCPYLAPVPNRGKRNDSSQLIHVAEEIAGLRGITVEEVIRRTTENAERLYRL